MTQPKRRYGGLIGSLEQFFAQNPDEELTLPDAAAKYDIPIKSVRTRISEAMREGSTLECVRIIRRRRS